MEKNQLYRNILERMASLISEKREKESEFLASKKVFEECKFWRVDYLEDVDVDEFFLAALRIEAPKAYEVAKEDLYKDGRKFFESINGKQAKLYFTKVADFFKSREEGNFENAKIEVIEGELTKSKLYFPVDADQQELLLSTHSYEEVLNYFSGLFSLAIKTDFFGLVSLQYACELHLFKDFLKEKIIDYKNKYNVDNLSSLPAEVFRQVALDNQKSYRKYLDQHHLEDLTGELINVYEDYKRSNEKDLSSLDRKIKKYSTLTKRIEQALSGGEVSDYRSLISGIDEDIRVSILHLIDKHNKQVYSSTEDKYNKISSDDKIKYQLLFRKYGIDESSYSLEDVSKYSLEDAENFLSKLTDLGIKESSVLIEILKKGSVTSLNKLSKHIKKGIIKLDFAQNNPDLFNASSDVYNNVVTNIDRVIESNVTPTYIMENQDVLLIPTAVLAKSLEVLDEYGLKASLTLKTPACLLNQQHLDEVLDTIIEQGHEETLKRNLAIAAYSKEDWKKVELLRQLNIEVAEEELETVLMSKSFVVGEEEIENYIYRPLSNEENSRLNNMEDTLVSVSNPLEVYAVSDLSYNIGGVVVSRKKVQRNLRKLANLDVSSLEKMLLSVVNNMSITYDEEMAVKQTIGVGVVK